jgi:hypothetical protein
VPALAVLCFKICRGARKDVGKETEIMRQPIRRHELRCCFALAAALASFSTTGARADEWCGYATRDNAVIECGYTTVAGCESAVGKGGMCFVDPDTAFNIKHATPASTSNILRRALGRG